MSDYYPIWCEDEYAYMRNDAGILWRRRLTHDYKYEPWEVVNEAVVNKKENPAD